MKKTALAPTAALVLKMALPIYQEPVTKKYLSRVDMSSGDEMFNIFTTSVYPLNRKFYIRKTLLKMFAESPTPFQWVVIAAGVCPMPLEILSLVPDKIAHIYEVDVAFMPEKKKLYETVAPSLMNRISCVTADIAAPDLPTQLLAKGFDPTRPTFLQMEGISYYITHETVQKILGEFSSHNGQNRMFVDYLLPNERLSQAGRERSEFIFGTINAHTGCTTTTRYTAEEIRHYLANRGGSILEHKIAYDLEKERTGKHEALVKPEDGLIEIILGIF